MLSKSKILSGLQCHKQLYLNKHNPDLASPHSASDLQRFKTGHEVGILAQKLFPGGIDVTEGLEKPGTESSNRTKNLLLQENSIIYEATLIAEQVLVAVDILVKNGNDIKIYEVKSGSNLKNVNVVDAAIQKWVLEKLGYKVSEVYVITLNKMYRRGVELDINELFALHDLTDKVLEWQEEIEAAVPELKIVLLSDKVPEVQIGTHCSKPYECAFKAHCWNDVPNNSVFKIKRILGETAAELYHSGIKSIEDLKDLSMLNEQQQLQVKYTSEGKHIDKEKIKGFVDDLEFPLYFLDFETFMPAIPLFKGSKTYEFIPFQYSLHVLETPDSNLQHYEYLAPFEETDARSSLAEHLIARIGTKGNVLAYNTSFENRMLKYLAITVPKHSKALSGIGNRLKDLIIPFRNMWYYDKAMEGSASIKKVLPALIPELSYNDFTVKEGDSASTYFFQAYTATYDQDLSELRENLLEYCKMDTLAMVEIYRKLAALSST